MVVSTEALKTPVYPPGALRTHSKSWTIAGDGFMVERQWFGIWFGHERRVQKWSPLMVVVEQIRFVRIGHIKLSFTSTYKVFKDGKEPAVVKGDF